MRSSWTQSHSLLLTCDLLVFFFSWYSDNLTTDICGANLYNQYLAQQQAKVSGAAKLVSQGAGAHMMEEGPEEQLASTAAQCRSILVTALNTSLARSCFEYYCCRYGYYCKY